MTQYLFRNVSTGTYEVKSTHIPIPHAEVGDIVGYLDAAISATPYDYCEGTVEHIQITQSRTKDGLTTAIIYTLKDGSTLEDTDVVYSYAP